MQPETELLAEIRAAWGWVGIDPEAILTENAFGNLLIRDRSGAIWRMCPEDGYCEIISSDASALHELLGSPEFQEDWEMLRLVQLAYAKVGELRPEHKYYLVVPASAGGAYTQDNLNQAPLIELIRFSGGLASFLRDLPPGAPFQLKVVD